MKFRKLRADEIEVRIGSVKKDGSGFSILLYKDARVDQNILDETVGSLNWQRHHSRDNANCIVSIWDENKQQWIEKEDTGTESNTEKEKGLASDSFKRACFNWGIGRELYTTPSIWMDEGKFKDKYDRFKVQSIGYDEDGVINDLVIYNQTLKKIVYDMKKTSGKLEESEEPELQKKTKMDERAMQIMALDETCKRYRRNRETILSAMKLSLDVLTVDQIKCLIANIEKKYGGNTCNVKGA